MAGISSKAAGKLENKKGYNGNELQNKEFSDGSGLDVYDFNARTYDQQIGRFIQIDPLTEEGGQESLSPFHFSENNPVLYSDPDGRFPFPAIPIIIEGVKILGAAVIAYVGAKEIAPVITNAVLNSEATKETTSGSASKEGATTTTEDTNSYGENAINLDGSFSITKEKRATFPDPALQPSDKLRVLQGEEYFKNRTSANNANAKIHRKDPNAKGKEIHEKDPVKFGGSPTDPSNKAILTSKEHAEITKWFNQLAREIKQFKPKK